MRGKGIKFEAQMPKFGRMKSKFTCLGKYLPFQIHAYLTDEIDQLEFIFKIIRKIYI